MCEIDIWSETCVGGTALWDNVLHLDIKYGCTLPQNPFIFLSFAKCPIFASEFSCEMGL